MKKAVKILQYLEDIFVSINYMGEAQKCSESDKKVLVIKRTDLKSQGQVLSFY